MKTTNPTKRIYYIPGILTLAIAPILFITRTDQYITKRTEHCIETTMIGKNDPYFPKIVLSKRSFQTYQLSGGSKDSSTLVLVENIARGLGLSKNDSLGIKVVLHKNVKYKTYIDLFNACLKSGINNWVTWGDTVFIYHNSLQPDFLMMPCGGCVWVCLPVTKPTLMQILKNNKDDILFASPFVILYLILVYFNIRKIRKNRK
jgi:hypothetical protein